MKSKHQELDLTIFHEILKTRQKLDLIKLFSALLNSPEKS